MKYIVTLVWAVIIGSTLAYILSSMKEDPFMFTQAIAYTITIFVIITLIEGVLGPNQETSSK